MKIPVWYEALRVGTIESGLDASTLMDRPFYHPTFEEGLKTALRQLCEQAGVTHPPVRDLGAPAGA